MKRRLRRTCIDLPGSTWASACMKKVSSLAQVVSMEMGLHRAAR